MEEYFNLQTNQIENPNKLTIRKGEKLDVDFGLKIPKYALISQNFTSYAYSDIELVYSLVKYLQGLEKLTEYDVEIKHCKRLYPQRDVKYILEEIINHHNSLLEKHCAKIDDNPNPFGEDILQGIISHQEIRERQRNSFYR